MRSQLLGQLAARVVDPARPDHYRTRELGDCKDWMLSNTPAARARRAAAGQWCGDARVIAMFDDRVKLFDEEMYANKAPLVTGAECARRYLHELVLAPARKQRRQGSMAAKRVPWKGADLALLDLAPPFYARAATSEELGDLAYVDISACYYSLFSPLSLDGGYRRGEWIGAGGLMFPRVRELGAEKLLRNAIPGIARSRSIKVARGDTFPRERPAQNAFLAPALTGILMDTCHAIATMIVANTDCVYVCTDGFIVPARQAGLVREMLAEWWGLDSTIKAQGPGRVIAWGQWSVGGESTMSYREAAERADAGAPLPVPIGADARALDAARMPAPRRPAIEATGNLAAIPWPWVRRLAEFRRWAIATEGHYRALRGLPDELPLAAAARAIRERATPPKPDCVEVLPIRRTGG